MRQELAEEEHSRADLAKAKADLDLRLGSADQELADLREKLQVNRAGTVRRSRRFREVS